MDPLVAVSLVALIGWPLHWVVMRQIDKLADPRHLREQGVVIRREDALQAHSDAIGRYMDREIWGTVTFFGMLYRFDRIAGHAYRARVRPRELYLEPGLVYLTE